MPSRRVVYYITGHGLGHARRSSILAAALLERCPRLELHLWTAAPEWAFSALPAGRFRYRRVDFDPGCAELDALTIDPAGTAEGVRASLRRRGAAVREEADLLRAAGIRLVLADIPFLAAEIAAAAGIPCVGISNFTWDWIYEPLFAGLPDGPELVEAVRSGYASMDTLLRLPFPGIGPDFPHIEELPFIAAPPGRSAEEVLARLDLPPGQASKPRLLVALRGGVSQDALLAAARALPDWLLIYPDSRGVPLASNILPVPISRELPFAEVLALSDAILAKPGWGIVNDSIVHGIPLLWVPRTGFREDAVSMAEAHRWTRHQSLPRAAFEAGDWRPALTALMDQPAPPKTPRTDGAELAATFVLDRLG